MNSTIETQRRSEADLAMRLKRHPSVHARVTRLLDLIENAGGDVKRADDAERRAIEELRMMGQELLCEWGQQRSDEEARQLETAGSVVKQVKKTALAQHLW